MTFIIMKSGYNNSAGGAGGQTSNARGAANEADWLLDDVKVKRWQNDTQS